MAIREFTDAEGLSWRVWNTTPANAKTVTPELRDGWLSFDSGHERRRVGPIPSDWEKMSDERLALLCRMATPVRTTPGSAAIVDSPDGQMDDSTARLPHSDD